MVGKELLRKIESAKVFETLYDARADAARARYRALIQGLLDFAEKPASGAVWTAGGRVVRDFPELQGEVRLFAAPGRAELGGNHTDHNNGKVLAAAVHLSAAAAAVSREDSLVVFRSTGYADVVVDLAHADGAPNLEADPAERGTTEALVRGIAAQFAAQGTPVRGFIANADSTVLPGTGLSSSAAIDVLIAKIFDSFYGGGKRGAVDLAKMGWKAENNWFGKPCGLMDQIACASGGVVAIDFKDPENPGVSSLAFDLAALGYALCVVNTGGSHADLTGDYAAIPREMKAVARFFGKETLRDCSRSQVLEKAAELRGDVGDRAILRAFHYFSENSRVDDMKSALETAGMFFDFEERRGALGRFLGLIEESGKSSWELLQNNYAPRDPREQGISLALAISRSFLGPSGASRVQGGGFAGTIQAYAPLNYLDDYRKAMEAVFGDGAVTVLDIQQTGVTEIIPE
jgi:galactokinase